MKNSLTITFSKSAPRKKKVTIPEHFRDNDWAASIGSIQRKLDSLVPFEDEITFDFTKSRWIDPLPLLSLLIEIVRVSKRGIAAQANFSGGEEEPARDEQDQPYQKCPNRLLLFLAKEGFFDELIDHNIPARVGKVKLDKSVIYYCAGLPATPSYADARFVPIRLFDVPKLDISHETPTHADFSARAVEKILKDVEVSLHSRCSMIERRHILYTLRAVLQEFLHNVQEHAYPADTFSPAAIYVRYRQGGAKLASGPGRNFYESCIKLEIDNCELANRDWLDSRAGCLEVFFLDRGVGLVQKFSGKRNGDFSNVMRSTFLDGKSSKESRRTEHGGLHLLYNLMKRSNDFIRALNDKTWFGSSVPFDRMESMVAKPTTRTSSNEGLIGLAYHLRLSWRSPTDEPEAWRHFEPDEVDNVWKVLSKPASSCNEWIRFFNQCMVIDERFRDKEEFPVPLSSDYVLWLPKRGLMKWDILDKLESLAPRIDMGCTLVIADIPSMEAAMYRAAMSHSGFGMWEEWPKKFRHIVLATNRWTFAYAEYVIRENGTHGFTSFRTDEIPAKFKSGLHINAPTISFRLLAVHWLKWHDSRRLWNEIKKGGRNFLPEKVIWSEDNNHNPTKIINGYLDFPCTTHNYLCSQLYRNALGRMFGLLDERNHILTPVDRLADPSVHDVYAHEVYESPKHDKNDVIKIATGSVLVSGSTLHAMGLPDKSIHFFIHGDSEYLGAFPSLFHWMPEIDILDSEHPQKRIGKTSAIAPEGWLSIEIPRFDLDGKSVGKRNPEDSYKDWQNSGPIIAKLGHWHYEGHHDFLTINIPDAVEDAFARNGPLAQFLINNILHPLGIRRDSIKLPNLDYPSYPTSYPSILVYRSHPSSERIIDKVLGTLDPVAREEIMRWIFPVLPLRIRWGGSTLLIPPRMREEMRTALAKRENAIIFDDAAITGRTIQDLLTSLKDLRAKQPRVVTVVNRLRLPAESPAINYFWRLDVPTMGRQGTCPLCQAMDAAESLAREMVPSSPAHDDIKSWKGEWSHVSPLNEWEAGLDPLPLHDIQKKNYCYRHSVGKHLCQIQLYRSTGLTIHAAEIHAMTASDDYGLKKIRGQSDPAIQIELATSQLLLFGDELDVDLIRDIVIEGLLEPLAKLEDDMPNGSLYGSLAVLTIMRTLASIESKQVPLAVAKKAKEYARKLKLLRHGHILMAFLISRNLIDWLDDECYFGTRLLSTRHCDVATKLRSLFRETVTPTGNIHSEPIPALLKELEEGAQQPKSGQLHCAMNSLAKLRDVIKELGYDWASSNDGGSYTDKRSQLESNLIEAETAIRDKSTHADLKKSLQNVRTSLNEVSDCYFHRISPKESPKGVSFKTALADTWEQRINWDDVQKKYSLSGHPTIRHSSDSGVGGDFGSAQWVWLLWHDPLQTVIKDLVMNAAHPKKEEHQIPDPWGSGETELAHMWVLVKYGEQSACLTFANHSQDANIAFDEAKNGTRGKTRWNTLTELGGEIKLDPEMAKQNILAIQVYIPYAPYLQHHADSTGEKHAALQANDY